MPKTQFLQKQRFIQVCKVSLISFTASPIAEEALTLALGAAPKVGREAAILCLPIFPSLFHSILYEEHCQLTS